MADEASMLSNPAASVASNQPVTSDKEPILWSGNRAHIAGNLDAVGKYFTRTGKFQPLLNHRAVLLSNGILAVDSANTLHFLFGDAKASPKGSFDDPRDFFYH